jgi:rod shape-determining protein MreB and related proteins
MPSKRKSKTDDILFVGIDLGTSRSAIAASNGRREWVESYVGWPRDFVARKLLGKPVLFGEEALESRRSVTLVRPLEFGVLREGTTRDEEATRELIRHLIERAGAEDGQAVFAAVGVPAEALKVNKLAIRDGVKEHADSLMVVSEPFAVAYGLGALNNALVIDIGAGTIDFCVMHGTMPGEEDQRTRTQAGDYIDRQLYERLSEKFPTARLSETLVRGFKEKYGFVGEPENRVLVHIPVEGRFVEHDITDELQQACSRIVPLMAETAIDLISRYEPDFQEQLRRHVFLAGGGSQIKGIAPALRKALREYGSFEISVVDDPLFSGADGALALAKDMPEEYWEEM